MITYEFRSYDRAATFTLRFLRKRWAAGVILRARCHLTEKQKASARKALKDALAQNASRYEARVRHAQWRKNIKKWGRT